MHRILLMLPRLQIFAPALEPFFHPRQDRRSIRDHHQRCCGSQRTLYGRATIRKGAHGDQRDCRGSADGDVLSCDFAPSALAHARSRNVLLEPQNLIHACLSPIVCRRSAGSTACRAPTTRLRLRVTIVCCQRGQSWKARLGSSVRGADRVASRMAATPKGRVPFGWPMAHDSAMAHDRMCGCHGGLTD